MNALLNCPGCGFRGRLPDELAVLRTIVCPQCKAVIPVDQLRRQPATADESFPICVDGPPVAPLMPALSLVTVAKPPAAERPAPAPTPPPPAAERSAPAAERPASVPAPAPAAPPPPAAPPEVEPYTGDYMKDEAARFAQYVATRLGELNKKRLELAEAENRFESMTMERKQELHRARGAVAADADHLRQREEAFQAKETGLVAREAELAAREAEVAARESRVARAESRAADTDRRTAELRAAIDQLEARRTAMADERATLSRRAAELDRAELALHRRSAELDELDERLRLEQEEFESEREQARTG